MNERITNAINSFNAQIANYKTSLVYLNTVTLACVPDENGFDVVINGVAFFHVAEWSFEAIPTFVYCTIGIMREFYFEGIKTAE